MTSSRTLKKMEAAGRNLEQSVNTERSLKDARFWVKDIQEALATRRGSCLQGMGCQSSGGVQSTGTSWNGPGGNSRHQAGRNQTPEMGNSGPRGVGESPCLRSDSALKHFSELQAEIPGRLEALGKLGIDAAVRAFLLEVAGERATLGSMTPEVLESLQAKKAQSRFRVELI